MNCSSALSSGTLNDDLKCVTFFLFEVDAHKEFRLSLGIMNAFNQNGPEVIIKIYK